MFTYFFIGFFDVNGNRDTDSGTEISNTAVNANVGRDLCPGPATIRVGEITDTSNAINFNVIAGPLTPARCFPVTPTPTPSPTVGPQATGVTVNFDIQPRSVPPSGGTVNMALTTDTIRDDFRQFCNDPNADQFEWRVYEGINSGTQVRSGTQQLFDTTIQDDVISLNYNVPAGGGTSGVSQRNYYASIHCPSGAQVTKSSGVTVSYSQAVLTTGVTINNFDVTQKMIPSTASSVDFVLRISQQDPSLNCSGGLDWVVFYADTPDGYPNLVRSKNIDGRNTNLPLSSNPFNLDFRESNFQPLLVAIQSGTAYFRAALGCNLPIGNAIYTNNWALSNPICVAIAGGTGNCSVPGGQGFRIDAFGLSPKLICVVGDQQQFQMTFRGTIDVAQFNLKCGSSANSFDWGVYLEDLGINTKQLGGTQTINRTSPTLTFNISQPISLPTNDAFVGTMQYYGGISCPGVSIANRTNSSPVSVTYGSRTNKSWGCVAANNVFACSPSNLTNCSDASACAGRPCVEIGNNLCGQSAIGASCASGGGSGPTTPPQPGQTKTYGWQIINPFVTGTNNIQDVILAVVNWILNIAAALIVILIIYAGIRFMLAAGRPAEITRAKKILFWALMGFAVVLIGKGFIALVISVLQGNIPTFP